MTRIFTTQTSNDFCHYNPLPIDEMLSLLNQCDLFILVYDDVEEGKCVFPRLIKTSSIVTVTEY